MHISLAPPPKGCPASCSGKGVCDIVAGICTCNDGATGADCSLSTTPMVMTLTVQSARVVSVAGVEPSQVVWFGAVSDDENVVPTDTIVVDRTTNEVTWAPHASASTGDSAVVTVVATSTGGRVISRQFTAVVNSDNGSSELIEYVEPPELTLRPEASNAGLDDDDYDFNGGGDPEGQDEDATGKSKKASNYGWVAAVVVILLAAIGAAVYFFQKAAPPLTVSSGGTYDDSGSTNSGQGMIISHA